MPLLHRGGSSFESRLEDFLLSVGSSKVEYIAWDDGVEMAEFSQQTNLFVLDKQVKNWR